MALSRPAEKARNFPATLKRLLRFLAPQKFFFILAAALSAAGAGLSVVGPKVLGQITTHLGEAAFQIRSAPAFDMGYVANALLLMVCLYILSMLCNFSTASIMSRISQRTAFALREAVKEKLDRLPLKYFDERPHGEILSRVTNDMDNISNTLQQSLSQAVTSLITITGILVMMLSISPLLTLVTLVTLPASALLTYIIAKNSQKFFVGQQKDLGKLNAHVEEMFAGHKIVKAFGYEKAARQTFSVINDRLYVSGWKAQFVSGVIMPAMHLVTQVGYGLICVAGGVLVARRTVQIGDVQAFIQYMRTFTQPVLQTATIVNIIQSTVASAERVFEILDEAEERPDEDPPSLIPTPKGDIEFDHVNFSYSDSAPLIRDMSFRIRPGQTVAIVGPTGAGKTTLVNLMLRFYELKGGQIRVDGVPIDRMRRGDLRRLFGMVLQDTWLFNGSIGANIGYSSETAGQEAIASASKAACADHFIQTLPEGYQMILNEEASNISQGQKQLLTIARAILADPFILILDEATSSVDTRTEVLIQKAMSRLMEGRTSFVSAHRLSTIRNADLIWVMNTGDVVEQGAHDELMAAQGFYAELYNSQFAEVDA
jgi:ATP-binding cassette subfamily B protein